MEMLTNEDILKKINEVEVPINKRIYRISNSYLIRALIFVGLLSFVLYRFFHKISYDFKGLFFLLLQILLFCYILFYIYKVVSYRVYVDDEKIVQGKIRINISEIRNLEISNYRFAKNRIEKVLFVITNENKKYVFRLNIDKKYYFIKKISYLSKKEVKIKD